ncbi:formate C-acetyltransferase/glycerol dehydratase family glycyl radical enzyme [Christensenellaceae bacterium OttesenSCG-928-M15]|nr:formate C-acetyltransferase/glycerol dehydratase family glycyl radical enzyme [Christensenellaceae bacterium OttesenSCG-928-M15]
MYQHISAVSSTPRIQELKEKMLQEPRYMSVEQAKIITDVYRENPTDPAQLLRAKSLSAALDKLNIRIEPTELIVGNRTAGVRGGVVFPEAGISWVAKELDTLPTRSQDQFLVREGDKALFREEIEPFWKGRSLEDKVREACGPLVDAIGMVAKINQKDHAQGHICPDTKGWIAHGPGGLLKRTRERLAKETDDEKKDFYTSLILVLEAASRFMNRYAALALRMAAENEKHKDDLLEVARVCAKLSIEPAETFHEAVQSLWFLYVILHMESNASSFSPGRMDQYLYPYYRRDKDAGRINDEAALEIIECLFLKFNQIVYLRNSHSAKYFAGFPIGFNVAVGGQTQDGQDATNELSYLILQAQEHLLLPQPNLSARLYRESPQEFLKKCTGVIAKGSGMPQLFNDESIIPALTNQGITHEDAMNYAIVGCVELTTHGNALGFSDAAMFNMVKALELALNGGKCLLSGKQLGPDTGTLETFQTYAQLEDALKTQVDYFVSQMLKACAAVERVHQEVLPSPFLSSVINDCIERGLDVTKDGAHYNLSGIQVIQPANIADSLAAVKKLVYEENRFSPAALYDALVHNFEGQEVMRQTLLNAAPKYGNDVEWVDAIAAKWVEYFHNCLKNERNYRGGRFHTGLYTVSAHVPMGQNVGASMDGRKSREPLADGGMSAVYGRDTSGPTALLNSVSRINPNYGSNGTLLNMKFLPSFFETEGGIMKFTSLLRAVVALNIHHIQFNVVNRETLLAAKKEPEKYRGITIRVAGYTAYFTELSSDLQDEIIARTAYGDVG